MHSKEEIASGQISVVMQKRPNLDNAESDLVKVSTNVELQEPHIWRISLIGTTPKSGMLSIPILFNTMDSCSDFPVVVNRKEFAGVHDWRLWKKTPKQLETADEIIHYEMKGESEDVSYLLEAIRHEPTTRHQVFEIPFPDNRVLGMITLPQRTRHHVVILAEETNNQMRFVDMIKNVVEFILHQLPINSRVSVVPISRGQDIDFREEDRELTADTFRDFMAKLGQPLQEFACPSSEIFRLVRKLLVCRANLIEADDDPNAKVSVILLKGYHSAADPQQLMHVGAHTGLIAPSIEAKREHSQSVKAP